MPGWTTRRRFHNNIAYTPGDLDRAPPDLRAHGVGDQFRIHYDPSHAILMGQDTRGDLPVSEGRRVQLPDRRISRQGSGHRRARGRGMGLWRPDRAARRLGERPAVRDRQPISVNAWKKQTVIAEHELPGTARHDPLAYLQNRTRGLAGSSARRA